MSNKVVARSRVRVEADKMPLRRAYVPVSGKDVGPFRLGMHGEPAEYRGVDLEALDSDAIQPTTYDYLVIAAAG